MKRSILLVMLILGLAGLSCSTASLPFLSTPTPTPTITPIPTKVPPTPTSTPDQGQFMKHMTECLTTHFGVAMDYAGWTPLFCDDFSHPEDWVLQNYDAKPGTIQKAVVGGADELRWVVNAKVNNVFLEFIPIGPEKLGSFDLSMRAVKVSGPNSWFGLIFRYQESSGDYYSFVIDYGGQNASVWLWQNGQWIAIKDWTAATVIKPANGPEDWNTVEVRGEGKKYECSVNGQVVYSFEDDRLSGGWTGFSVSADPDTTTAFNFDDIVLLGKP
ncbi:MAG TPA: family 16 glycoside hydrolase [Anaerolineales bacterium]|nr:family 16 glycoside hydrolase [Anaerolineales bacterium]